MDETTEHASKAEDESSQGGDEPSQRGGDVGICLHSFLKIHYFCHCVHVKTVHILNNILKVFTNKNTGLQYTEYLIFCYKERTLFNHEEQTEVTNSNGMSNI